MACTEDEYVNMHYLTEMPKSIEKWKLKGFSLKALEEQINNKLTEQTARDDMFQDFLKIFRIRARRPGQQDNVSLRIYRHNFFDMLRHIGVFCTREQAQELFDKYDIEGRGSISVSQFFSRSRPNLNHNPFTERESGDNHVRGKKQYLATKLAGVPVQPHNPPSNVYGLTMDKIAYELKFKIQSSLETGKTCSDPFCRRYLARHFEFHDTNMVGYVTEYAMRRTLDKLNYPLGPNHRNMLLKTCPGALPGTFDYNKFVMLIFPDHNGPLMTSLGNAADSGINYLKVLQQEQRIPVRDLNLTPAPPAGRRTPGSQTFRPSTGSRPQWNSTSRPGSSRLGSQTYRGRQQLDWRTSKFPPGHPVYNNPRFATTGFM
mmetsp:Transcript_28403/g.39931  ORF Transcript_28403/g.39931 Transcript_28403/m.39931 type:complete len:373 (-) Transcript_28403:141-1259(-)|eukprot:CAMPEP_0175093502 /NCGR_PEP_ID=MMETSP0086_2-20121207/3056_1 /TAXON_ID=136419 /ORGANISM="Unknown Unknown, Strain D1" /LENGTH=372 /DNA_ID=CAMNT_0016366487 /DNA_START=75 /DNA_END=1193 /DNA_ORIENTATION=+